MKNTAAIYIIVAFLLALAMNMAYLFSDWEWSFVESPETGICYETYRAATIIGAEYAMSPVAHSYCEEE